MKNKNDSFKRFITTSLTSLVLFSCVGGKSPTAPETKNPNLNTYYGFLDLGERGKENFFYHKLELFPDSSEKDRGGLEWHSYVTSWSIYERGTIKINEKGEAVRDTTRGWWRNLAGDTICATGPANISFGNDTYTIPVVDCNITRDSKGNMSSLLGIGFDSRAPTTWLREDNYFKR